MYKTEIIKGIKKVEERALALTELINEQKTLGWDYVNALAVHKFNLIVVFVENPQFKLNENIDKGLNKIKDKVNKVVDSLKQNK